MTNVSSEATDGEAGRDDQPRVIRVKESGGEWREISVEPKITGDADMDRLWSMSLDDFEKIVSDPKHPLHSKAQVVQEEALEPVRASAVRLNSFLDEYAQHLAKAVSQGISSQYARVLKPITGSSSWPYRVMPELQKSWPSTTSSILEKYASHSAPSYVDPDPSHPPVVIDFDSPDTPEASVSEFSGAVGVMAYEVNLEIRDGINSLVSHAKDQKQSEEESLKVAKSAQKASWIAVAVAGLAVVVAVVLGVLQ